MIFVAVGTQKFQLNRLLKTMDDLIERGAITEEVFAQIGQSDYKPKNYKYEEFLNKEDFEKAISECSILVTHSGVGTIISGLNKEKPIVVFPRLAKYGEHVDDHQLEIAQSFHELNYVMICNDFDDLEKIIKKSKKQKFEKYESARNIMVSCIRNFLKEMN